MYLKNTKIFSPNILVQFQTWLKGTEIDLCQYYLCDQINSFYVNV